MFGMRYFIAPWLYALMLCAPMRPLDDEDVGCLPFLLVLWHCCS
jgi:hypothetical protein